MAMPRRGTPSGERPNRALTDARGYADLVLVAALAEHVPDRRRPQDPLVVGQLKLAQVGADER